MKLSLPDGVWPTMITPFDEEKRIDWKALDSLIEWYIEKGVDGLFAVCQSSEMFYLSLQERFSLAKYVVEKVNKRCAVIASGHVSASLNDQIDELNMMGSSGVDAVVLVVNRLAKINEDSSVCIHNLETIVNYVNPELALGLYECPYPYKRLLEESEIQWLMDSKRFYFLKDTSCSPTIQNNRIRITGNSGFKLYNANSATLLNSVQSGYSGYCGVMGNFHPELYRILLEKSDGNPFVSELNHYLIASSVMEYQAYPVNAKYFLSLEGLPVNMETRVPSAKILTPSMKIEVEHFRSYSRLMSKRVLEV